MTKKIKLSILDQSLIPAGGTAADALKGTVALAKLAEQWGYYRFWVSEHHNLPSIAGSAPEVLVARLGSETSRIRIGSGGIMLPNHSALKVAENFRTLEALYPGRIDLGMGRAPGGDRITASLLNPSNDFREDSYVRQLEHLQIFFRDEAGTEYGRILAVPQVSGIPQQWILGSSGGSSGIAARFGLGLAVARFINGLAQPAQAEVYRNAFVPSEQFPAPALALSIVVLCADTEEKAAQMRKSVDYQLLQIESGKREGIQTYESIKDYTFSLIETERLRSHRGKVISGTPVKVKEELTKLADDFDAEEIIVVTWTASMEDKIRSFELLAKEFGMCD